MKIFLVTIETSVVGAITYAFSTYEKAVAYVDEQAAKLARNPNDVWVRAFPAGETYRYHVRFGATHDQAYVAACELDEAP